MRESRVPLSVRALSMAAPVLVTFAALGADEAGYESDFLGPIPGVKSGMLSALTAIVVFGIVMLILGAKVWPMIQSGLADRENKILEEIAAAEAAREQAKAALEEYEQSLAKARGEAQSMIDETKARQAELASELRAKADAELTAMRQKALADIEAARKAAISEIYEESVTLATTIAGKILQREVTPSDTDRLVNESLSELKAAGAIRDN